MTEIHRSNFNSFGGLLQTPPYSSTYDCCRTAVPLVEQVMSVNSEKQMHCLRFPTPPTTPHKEQNIQTSPAPHRTFSVIMKVNHGSHHVAETLLSEPSAADGTLGQRTLSSNEFLCNWIGCKLSFKTLETLVIHVTQIHAVPSSDDGLYYCMWEGCSRSTRGFNARYKMLVHVRTHTKEKPHQCHLCKKSFSRAENLKIHIRSHSGERPYQCTFEGCRKAYSNSSDRFKHTRTHSMEKPYICKVPGCQKRYTDPSSLRKHVKTFRHMECSLAQITESYLPSHRIEAHSIDDNSEKLLQIRIDDAGDEVMSSKGEIYLPSSYVHAVDCCRKDENLMNYKWNNYYTTHTPSSCTGYWITTENADFYPHRFPLNSASSAMHTDLPLDLRTTRR